MAKKKSASEIEKMVDSQAKGKAVKGAKVDGKKSAGGELDTRRSKMIKFVDY